MSIETNTNPGEWLDDMGVTCEMLYSRHKRTGNYSAMQAMWDALQEYAVTQERVDSQYPDEFGAEV